VIKWTAEELSPWINSVFRQVLMSERLNHGAVPDVPLCKNPEREWD